jgi:hypothetical protein
MRDTTIRPVTRPALTADQRALAVEELRARAALHARRAAVAETPAQGQRDADTAAACAAAADCLTVMTPAPSGEGPR